VKLKTVFITVLEWSPHVFVLTGHVMGSAGRVAYASPVITLAGSSLSLTIGITLTTFYVN